MLKESKPPKQIPKNKANKVVIIGDSNVGKTCLITRYVDEKFGDTQPTIGALHRMKSVNGVDLDLWDTAGQEQYKSLTRNFYRNSNGVIIVYDVTNKSSFEKVQEWVQSVYDNTERSIQMVLVGNKIDLNREVSTDEGKKDG